MVETMNWHTPEPANSIMKEMEHLMKPKILSLTAYVFDVDNCNQKDIACGDGKETGHQTRLDLRYHGVWTPHQKIVAHAHDQKEDEFLGQICFDSEFLKYTTLEILEGVVAHEVAHFGHREHDGHHDKLAENLLDRYRKIRPFSFQRVVPHRLREAWSRFRFAWQRFILTEGFIT